jgi:hypothetical protein
MDELGVPRPLADQVIAIAGTAASERLAKAARTLRGRPRHLRPASGLVQLAQQAVDRVR